MIIRAKTAQKNHRAQTWAILAVLFSGVPTVQAQQVSPLRPGLDVNTPNTETATGAQNQNGNTPLTAPVQRTNAPQPIRLLSNQPQQVPAPPPPARRPPRETDPFEPLGVKVGGFRLFPVLEVTTDLSDNARTDPSGKITDIAGRLAPSFRLESNWLRHSYNLNVSSEHIFYAKASDVNSNTFTGTSALRLDIRRNTNLLNTATYQLTQTSSASSEVPGTAIGNRADHEVTYTSALTHRFNRLIATATAGINWVFVDDVKLAGGGRENNADREYIEPTAKLRLGYEVSPAITPFVEVGYTPRIHRKTLDRNGLARNSQGFTASSGFGFNLSPIWDGEVSLTYEHRNYKDNRLDDVNALGVNATINWRPSELTTVSLVAATDIEESSTIGISGTRNFDLALDVSHKFRDNITGTMGFGLNYDDFIGTGNDDVYFTMQAGFAYALRRELEWVTNYQFTHFKSGTAGNNYTENRISTGLRFRL